MLYGHENHDIAVVQCYVNQITVTGIFTGIFERIVLGILLGILVAIFICPLSGIFEEI